MPLIVGNSVNLSSNDIWGGSPITLLNRDNPSAINTKIVKVEVMMSGNATSQASYVGTFYGSGVGWTVRSYVNVGTLVPGVNTFINLNIDCMVGDIIGIWNPNSTNGTYVRTSRAISGAGYVYSTSNTFFGGYYSYTQAESIGYVLLSGFSADGKKINGVLNTKWNSISISKYNGV